MYFLKPNIKNLQENGIVVLNIYQSDESQILDLLQFILLSLHKDLKNLSLRLFTFQQTLFLTNKMVGSIPQLCVSEVMPIQFFNSLRASNINFCSGLSLLIPKDSRTCANSLLYYSIFVCNPKILFLTFSLIG